MENEICPKCNRKQLYFRSAFNTWRCAKCKSFFDKEKNYVGIEDRYAENSEDIRLDEYGNTYSFNIEKTKAEIIVTKKYKLQEGKTTLKTEYPKIYTDDRCEHKDRLSCNFGFGFERCKNFMFVNNTWVCKK